jgi:very-short-patch-repair endonuclease
MALERARSLRRNPPEPERRVWMLLRDLRSLGFHFRRQVPIGPYYADFACHHARLVIEVDGDTHGGDAAVAYDAERDGFLRRAGYAVLRFSNHDVMHELDGVRRALEEALRGRATLPTPTPSGPSPQGGGAIEGESIDSLPPEGRDAGRQGGGRAGSTRVLRGHRAGQHAFKDHP